jgi:hypothetical protein
MRAEVQTKVRTPSLLSSDCPRARARAFLK